MRTRFIANYSIGLGIAVFGLWAVLLAAGPLPEGAGELAFHLTSEALMALGCIIGGVLLLRSHPTARAATAAAHAMVVYSTLNAAGYYWANGAPAVTLPMTLLALVSAAIAIRLIRHG